jgi:hypothetical protein
VGVIGTTYGKVSNQKGELIMKRFAYALALLAVVGMTSAAYADLESAAVAKVFATVNPNVAVNYDNGAVNAGTIQTGEICADIVFRIDANKESVLIFVEASDLWKGDDPTNNEVLPIPLAVAEGAVVDPANANPLGSGSNVAEFIGAGSDVMGFPTQLSATIGFESSQNNRFSQDVTVTICWDQDDDEKPMGEYSGVVKLTSMIIPS